MKIMNKYKIYSKKNEICSMLEDEWFSLYWNIYKIIVQNISNIFLFLLSNICDNRKLEEIIYCDKEGKPRIIPIFDKK